jgi:beta-xylosidase
MSIYSMPDSSYPTKNTQIKGGKIKHADPIIYWCGSSKYSGSICFWLCQFVLLLFVFGGLINGFTAELASAGSKPWGDWQSWGDQGDGTYRNPVLPSDYSDIDCIRVGPDYYAISSTFQYSPGVVILHSKDLVNWRIIGHVVEDLTQVSPELNWNRMNRYGRGIWAGAIRHHDGRFWVYFGAPDEGYFMSTATNAAGPWEPLHCLLKESGWDDCCPFWDDDGQGYFVGTCFKDGYKTWLFKLTPDGRDLVKDSSVVLNQGSGREANKLYKGKGYYYHLFSEFRPGAGRYVMMQRATNITGPYIERRQISHAQPEAHEPNQGGLVQTEQGDWYFFTHHGAGDWEGRCASLLPVTWVDGWPVFGNIGGDGIGDMVWSGKKPDSNAPILTPQADDDFNGPKPDVQWEWNYQPRADKWSLTERPGFLRLHAFKPLQRDNLKKAGNTLTQRVFRASTNVVTLALDLNGMTNGQVAGLCHYSKDYSTIGARCENGIIMLESARNQAITNGPVLRDHKLWLRSTWGLDGKSQYAYSINGADFMAFGEPYQLGWGDYRGDRIGIFSYNNDADAGYVDCDSFTYHYDSPTMTEISSDYDKATFGQTLIPDMVADPSVVDINGTFYCYATTDGWGHGLATSGTPVVWTSKDFLNWSFHGSSFPTDFNLKYWAPSSIVHRNGRYYSFPTLDGKITPVVSDSPLGPFMAPDGQHVTKTTLKPFPIEQNSAIDAEVFIDDDGQAYMVWSRRREAKLKPDLLSTDGLTVAIPTKRQGYSEGPFLTKRKGVYYYFYTLGGGETYQYAYMMSRTSPMGPWEAPEQDIIATTDHAAKIIGPGHGCFFHPQDNDQWYFVYLEFGRGGTTRQIYADKMNFNDDGTIQPIKLTKSGVGALRPDTETLPNVALDCTATASSTRPNYRVRHEKDSTLDRIETYAPANALDGLNGTRWLAVPGDKAPWFEVDLGASRNIRRTEAFFVKPAAGHAYRLEWSLDGQKWNLYDEHDDVVLCSPHCDEKSIRARYLKLSILKGEPGLWEFRVYGEPASATR